VKDPRDELLEEIERELRDGEYSSDLCECECECDHTESGIRRLLEKARADGIIKYPRP
jgi:hypothetical protein